MKRAEKSPVIWPVTASTAIAIKESICPDCEVVCHDPPGTSVMCLKCGAWMVTESVPED